MLLFSLLLALPRYITLFSLSQNPLDASMQVDLDDYFVVFLLLLA
jgi:hypothetical protein